jgi:NADH-quinone oxidoreductase subunit G
MILGGDPTIQAPATAWNLRTNVRNNRGRVYIANSAEIKLRRQAKAFAHIAPFSYGALASFLAGDDSAIEALTRPGADTNTFHNFRNAIRAEERLLVLLGSEFRGADLARLLSFGATLPNWKFALLSDYANSRGAADMGLLRHAPGLTPVAGGANLSEYNAPAEPGPDCSRFERPPRRTVCPLRRRLEPHLALQHRSRDPERHLHRRAGYVPHGDRPLLMLSFPPRTSTKIRFRHR